MRRRLRTTAGPVALALLRALSPRHPAAYAAGAPSRRHPQRSAPPAVLALCAAAAALAPGSSSRAHDTWLIPSTEFVIAGDEVRLHLTSGMEFPQLDYAIKPERVARAGFRLRGSTHEIDRSSSDDTSLVLNARFERDGVASCWISLHPKEIDLTEEDVAHYFEEIAAPDSVRRAWEAAPRKRWHETYTKHAKTFVIVHECGGSRYAVPDSSYADPAGLALEIVPERNPTALSKGDLLAVRVLKKGAPYPGVAVGFVREGRPEGTIEHTDSEGRAHIVIDREGWWLVRATDLRRRGDDWESDFTTMTFSVLITVHYD